MKIVKVQYSPSSDENRLIRFNIDASNYDISNYMGEMFYLNKNLERAHIYRDAYIVVEIYYKPQLYPKIDEMVEQAKLIVRKYMNNL